MKSKLLTVSSIVCMTFLAGCNNYDLKEAPGFQFVKEQPIHLNVSNFKIINIPVGNEEQTTKNLRLALESWATTRFIAHGGEKKAVLIVEHAKMNTYQDEYDGKVRVKLEILDDRGFVSGAAHASVDRAMKLPVDLSTDERENQFKRLVEEMINDIDYQLTKELTRHLPNYISGQMS